MLKAAAAALVPWLVLVGLWELAAARGWMTTTLFPPPTSFLKFAVASDFRVGVGQDGVRLARGLRHGGHAYSGGDHRQLVPRGGGPVHRLCGGGGDWDPGVDVEVRLALGAADRARSRDDRADRLDPDRHHRVRLGQ